MRLRDIDTRGRGGGRGPGEICSSCTIAKPLSDCARAARASGRPRRAGSLAPAAIWCRRPGSLGVVASACGSSGVIAMAGQQQRDIVSVVAAGPGGENGVAAAVCTMAVWHQRQTVAAGGEAGRG